MKKRKVCLIINPRDGQNVVKLIDILAVLAAAGCETRVVLKEYAGHTQELARQATKDGCDLVISYGGDGTLNQVVNGVMNAGSKPELGVIAGGTANLWATEIGMPTDNPIKAVLALLDSESRSVDIGHASVAGLSFPGDEQHAQHKRKKHSDQESSRANFLLMAGLGLDAAVMQGVSKPLKHRIKQLAVGLSAAKELPEYHPFSVELRDKDHHLLWQGEALQVVVGNTRLYADILHMTPNAYIDDGQLDICVITSGNFLGTVQQIFSLLLRRQPDGLTAEYFKGARVFLKVPSLTALQFDGSAIKLKDFLPEAEKKALKAADNPEEATIEYCFEAVPQALHMAIPRTYDEALFEESGANKLPTSSEHAELSATSSEPSSSSGESSTSGTEVPASSQPLATLREKGRKITVVGASFDAQHGKYIVAGSYTQAGTGARKPVALRIDDSATILNSSGEKLAPAAVKKLNEGQEILVIGKKSKRGVIAAQHVLV